MTLEISIIIPDRIFWKIKSREIILPTLSGQMGVLTNHIPTLTGLDTGLVLVRDNASLNWVTVIITGGFALVSNNTVTILVNEAEFGSDIDITKAEANYLASKNELESNIDPNKNFELTSQFKKARSRFNFIQSLKNRV